MFINLCLKDVLKSHYVEQRDKVIYVHTPCSLALSNTPDLHTVDHSLAHTGDFFIHSPITDYKEKKKKNHQH